MLSSLFCEIGCADMEGINIYDHYFFLLDYYPYQYVVALSLLIWASSLFCLIWEYCFFLLLDCICMGYFPIVNVFANEVYFPQAMYSWVLFCQSMSFLIGELRPCTLSIIIERNVLLHDILFLMFDLILILICLSVLMRFMRISSHCFYLLCVKFL